LYFHGEGDPYLTPERFWLLLNRIKIFGIHSITGNVYFDNTYFDPEPVDYNKFDEQPYRTYNVGPNALLVGFQATEFHFSPGNKQVTITPFPSSPRLKVNNKLKLVNGACGSWRKRLSLDAKTVKGILNVTFSGRYASACGKRIMYRRVSEADDHFQHYFLPLWQQLGGGFSGAIEKRKVPEDTSLVISESSVSLAEVVRFINKFSNNVMTRQLLLTLGANTFGPPGTTEKGIKAIKQWLDQHKLNGNALKMDNGAGLSRDARISAAILGKLLHFVYQQSYMPEFIASLPVTGYDGTMAYRFKNGPLTGHAHIKTGLLDFVQSMAGYVTTTAGKRNVVVMLHNHPRAHTKAAERLQNDIIQWVFDQE
jgi:D-alanyl-D-alanine carboxypeptidase/D-alanyl-D-alanine-endopeptidase (penicillin-binding protein 4)